jgi:hypothetical protein
LIAASGPPSSRSGLVDLAHAAAADHLGEPIAPERLPGELTRAPELRRAIELRAHLAPERVAHRHRAHRAIELLDRLDGRPPAAPPEVVRAPVQQLDRQLRDDLLAQRDVERVDHRELGHLLGDDQDRQDRVGQRAEQEQRQRAGAVAAQAEEVDREQHHGRGRRADAQ